MQAVSDPGRVTGGQAPRRVGMPGLRGCHDAEGAASLSQHPRPGELQGVNYHPPPNSGLATAAIGKLIVHRIRRTVLVRPGRQCQWNPVEAATCSARCGPASPAGGRTHRSDQPFRPRQTVQQQSTLIRLSLTHGMRRTTRSVSPPRLQRHTGRPATDCDTPAGPALVYDYQMIQVF